MAMAQHIQTSQFGDDASCEGLKQGHLVWERCSSEVSTAAPSDSGSDAGSDFGTAPYHMPGGHGAWMEAGTISALVGLLVLPMLLALLFLPEPIALTLGSFYLVTMLSCTILPGMLARGGCVAIILPCLYTLGALTFMAKQIPPM